MKYKINFIKYDLDKEGRWALHGCYTWSNGRNEIGNWYFDSGMFGFGNSSIRETQLVSKELCLELIEKCTPEHRKQAMREILDKAPTFNEGEANG